MSESAKLNRAIEYIYQNTNRTSTYNIKWTFRAPTRQWGGREIARTVALRTAAKLGAGVNTSPGRFTWHRCQRVFEVSVRMSGSQRDLINGANAGYRLWKGVL
jgi:hypothetical protein